MLPFILSINLNLFKVTYSFLQFLRCKDMEFNLQPIRLHCLIFRFSFYRTYPFKESGTRLVLVYDVKWNNKITSLINNIISNLDKILKKPKINLVFVNQECATASHRINFFLILNWSRKFQLIFKVEELTAFHT